MACQIKSKLGLIGNCTFVDILDAEGISSVPKWVDDFEFFRYPMTSKPSPLSVDHWRSSKTTSTSRDMISGLKPIIWDSIGTWRTNKRVSLSEKKRLKYLGKVSRFLAAADSGKVKLPAVSSIHGTLQHVSFVYPATVSWFIFSPTTLSC